MASRKPEVKRRRKDKKSFAVPALPATLDSVVEHQKTIVIDYEDEVKLMQNTGDNLEQPSSR